MKSLFHKNEISWKEAIHKKNSFIIFLKLFEDFRELWRVTFFETGFSNG